MPTGRSSAEPGALPGPVRSLGLVLLLRLGSLGARARVALAVGLSVMVALTALAVALPPGLRFEPELVEAMRRYLPAGFLAFFVTSATAVLFAGGGREALPADQAVAYPIGPSTDHLAALIMAPLNLAWLLQTWTLLFTVSVLTTGGHQGAALLPVVLWLLACTAMVQLLAWAVECVRRGPHGDLIVRTAAGLLLVAAIGVVGTGHLLAVTAWTPAAWASALPDVGARGDWLPWALGCLALVAVTVASVGLGARAARWTWRRPATTQARVETRRYAPRPFPHSDLQALVAVDRGSVWRAAPLRRGLVLLSLLPVIVAFAGQLDWLMVPVLPGLVASGGALLFGVNAWALDARGAVWRDSLPVRPRTVLLARAWVLVEVLTAAALATLVICGLRAGVPRSAELSAALSATVVVALRTVASGLRWSVRRPYSVDLRSVRATPAPPLVMVAYSARLALGATLTGLVFSVLGRLFPWWWCVLVALVLCATSVFSLWRTARMWERPEVRSHIVETVSSV
ncbi:MAG: hypothetical protein M3171_08775 [Actinomycetota bacterium]|nr:hypothetical protein [Actinomycetota bacterium]